MAKSSPSGDLVAHAIAGTVAAGISYAIVPVRNRGDYLARAFLGALLSAVLFRILD